MKITVIFWALLLFGGLRSQTEGLELRIVRSMHSNVIPHIYADAAPRLQEMVVNDLPDMNFPKANPELSNSSTQSSYARKISTSKKNKSLPKI